MSKFRDCITIIVGLAAMMVMVAIIVPALLVLALIERARIQAESEFDETGRPILPEIEQAKRQHEEGWRW
jgi:hypothetical protein